jgi:hypothetical protein
MPEFPHAHSSELVCIPGERADALDCLRSELAAEHRPATVTEELLVDEMAQHYWRMKRYRYLEASMWMADERGADGKLTANLELVQWNISSGCAAHYHRCLVSAERAFYRALNSLRGMQKERGFVFTNSSEVPSRLSDASEPKTQAATAGHSGFVFSSDTTAPPQSSSRSESGFVFTNSPTASAHAPQAEVGFVFANPQKPAQVAPAQTESGFVFTKTCELQRPATDDLPVCDKVTG